MNHSIRFINTLRSALLLPILSACLVLLPEQLIGQDPFGGGEPLPSRTKRTPQLPDPVVEFIRESNPQTADELVYAMKSMVDYGRVDEAKRYQSKLMELEIDDQTMFDLNMKYGSALFIRFRQIKELRPSSAILAQKILTSANRIARSPARIQSFISQLSSDNLDTRISAMSGLMMAREDAIQPIVRDLMDDSKADIHDRMISAVAGMGAEAIEPVIAIARTDDEESFKAAGRIMQAQKDRGILPLLCGKLLTSSPDSDVEKFTIATFKRITNANLNRRIAVDYLNLHFQKLQHQMQARAGDLTPVPHWVWNADEKTLVRSEQPLSKSLLADAVEVADWIQQFDPDSIGGKLRYWLLRLTYDKLAIEPHATLDASQFGKVDVSLALTILREAIKRDEMEAAIGAMQLLGKLGNESLLRTGNGQNSLVVEALHHPNYRLRFAATEAIANWNPPRSFTGSSYYLKNLALLAGVTNDRRVLIVEPNGPMADDLAGFFNSIGFFARAYNSGHDFIRQTDTRVDFEFAIISGSVNRPGTLEVLQRLRRTPRTGRIPVALVGHADQMDRLREYAGTDELAMAFSWPTSRISLQFVADKMSELAGRNYVSPDQKLLHAKFAYDQLLKIARNREKYPFYSFLQYETLFTRATYEPDLSHSAIELLGHVATPSAQQLLVDLASSTSLDVDTRRVALGAFSNAIQLRDILLTSDQLQTQYDRYNASKFLDKDTQEIRGSILDLLEARAKGRTKQAK